MRHLLLLAALASACDQGATAATPTPAPVVVPTRITTPSEPPRYVIRDDADFAAKAMSLLQGLLGVFADGSKDCELLASRVETFAGENATMFSVLTEYGKAHPNAEKLVQAQFEPQMNDLVKVMMPAVTACASHQRLMTAFQKLSSGTQQLQRPR